MFVTQISLRSPASTFDSGCQTRPSLCTSAARHLLRRTPNLKCEYEPESRRWRHAHFGAFVGLVSPARCEKILACLPAFHCIFSQIICVRGCFLALASSQLLCNCCLWKAIRMPYLSTSYIFTFLILYSLYFHKTVRNYTQHMANTICSV